MSVRYYSAESWDTWDIWVCPCGRHQFSLIYVATAQPGEAVSRCCRSQPTRLVRIRERERRPNFYECAA